MCIRDRFVMITGIGWLVWVCTGCCSSPTVLAPDDSHYIPETPGLHQEWLDWKQRVGTKAEMGSTAEPRVASLSDEAKAALIAQHVHPRPPVEQKVAEAAQRTVVEPGDVSPVDMEGVVDFEGESTEISKNPTYIQEPNDTRV
eukprot:TRINITY_DN61985_c0_g1_i2.p1 TRINITY_DN61985_c0_g1~~TRINITY_DN61985_c0_g1_i2.p1  ORF type:complete len:143 (-),score=35.32 TRINITY_DN61985_c0_g1_i2:72-500(-)